jgi:hypothetical protein
MQYPATTRDAFVCFGWPNVQLAQFRVSCQVPHDARDLSMTQLTLYSTCMSLFSQAHPHQPQEHGIASLRIHWACCHHVLCLLPEVKHNHEIKKFYMFPQSTLASGSCLSLAGQYVHFCQFVQWRAISIQFSPRQRVQGFREGQRRCQLQTATQPGHATPPPPGPPVPPIFISIPIPHSPSRSPPLSPCRWLCLTG